MFDIKIQVIPHRKHSFSLASQTGESSVGM